MLRKKITLLFFSSILFLTHAFSQSLPTYNHYYIHPYFYNPSYLAAKNHTEISVIHRQQWAGLDGAPTFSHVSFILPFSNKVATGLNVYNYTSGILTTTSALASFSYAIDFDNDTYLSFGLSGGAGRNSIDVNKIDDLSDPVFAGQLDKSFFLEGQVGLNFQLRKLNLGVSLPQLFKRSLVSSKDLQDIEFDAFNNIVASASYKFELSPDIAFEPLAMVKTNDVDGVKLGGYGTLYLKQLFWVGGAYKQDYGASAYAGFQVTDKIQIGYSYEFGTASVPEINNNTHEFRIAIQFGRRKVNRQEVNTAKAKAEEEVVAEETEKPAEEKVEEPIKPIEETVVVKNEPAVQKTQPPVIEEQPVRKDEQKPLETTPPSLQQTLPAVKEQDTTPIAKTTTAPTPPIEKPVEETVIAESPVIEKIKPKPPIERVVKAATSKRSDELKNGVYVIVGVFGVPENAKKYINQLKAGGYNASMGHYSGTKLNYVYVLGGQDLDEARHYRDELRSLDKFQFPNAWILKVEE